MLTGISNTGSVAPTEPSKAATTDEDIPESPNILPEPVYMNNPMAELEALMVQMKGVEKQQARETRRLAEDSIQRAVDGVIAHSESKADAQMWAGVISGAGQMASGALQFTSAFKSDETAKQLTGLGKLAEGAAGTASAGYAGQAIALDGALAADGARLAAGERDASAAQAAESEANQGMRELLGRVERIQQAEQGAQQAALFRA